MVITDENNKELLPGNKGYRHEGNYGNSTYIMFNDIIHLQQGKELRLWYSEDLRNYYDSDNAGTSCSYVLARKV